MIAELCAPRGAGFFGLCIDPKADIRHAVRMASPCPIPDTSNWPTQTQAAAVLGTNERTIRRWIESGRLHSSSRPAVGRKPLTIVDPEDVERIRLERLPPVVLRDQGEAASNHTAHPDSMAIGPHIPAAGASLQHFLAGVLQAYPVSRPKSWLTLDEAAEVSGLPKAWLLAQARAGEAAHPSVVAVDVGTEKQSRWRFNRDALGRCA